VRFKSCGQFGLGSARKASVKKKKSNNFLKKKATFLLSIKLLKVSTYDFVFKKQTLKMADIGPVQAKTANRR